MNNSVTLKRCYNSANQKQFFDVYFISRLLPVSTLAIIL